MLTNNSFEYVVCNRLHKIKYLLLDFIRMNNPCYCKLKLYELISIFVSKFVIHNVYFIDSKVIPKKSDIFNEYFSNCELYRCEISDFLLYFANKVISFYYDLIYDSYVSDLKYLFNNYDVEFFEKFIDDIIDKFFENTIVLVSGFGIKCNDVICVGKCPECLYNVKPNNTIRFYIFDEFIENLDGIFDILNYVCSKLNCKEVDFIIDGRFITNHDNCNLDSLRSYISEMFKSIVIDCK